MKDIKIKLAEGIEHTISCSSESYPKVVILDFYATWCNPCKVMSTVLDEIVKKYSGNVLVEKYDIEENDAIVKALNIRSVPTILICNCRDVLFRHNGPMTKEELEKIIEEVKKYDHGNLEI